MSGGGNRLTRPLLEETTMEEDEDLICPRCKHETLRPHMHYGYIDWWECDWCGYSTDRQERIFTAKETK